jgi:RNA 2',3'-cyclic 3'-phosphodiesterase
MRTFLALNLPPGVRLELHAALGPLRERPLAVRWTAADALHLTLKFLGDIEGAELAPLEAALRDVAGAHAPLEMRVGGFGAFPSLRRANVLWVGIAADPPLMALQRDIELACSRLGYAREQKPFRPHITVARTRGGGRPADVDRLAGAFVYETDVQVASIDLMRSHLGPGGASYEVLLRANLGKEPGS